MTKNQLRQLAKIAEAKRTGGKQPRKNGSIGTKPTIPCQDLPESKVVEQCLKWLKSRGILADRLNVGAMPSRDGRRFSRYGIKGAGDIIVCYEGRHIEIEAKAGKGGSLSIDQQIRQEQVEQAGGLYLIVHGVEELEYLLQKDIIKKEFVI